MTTGELPNQPSAPSIEMIGYLDRDHIQSHLNLISKLNGEALLNTLVPHRYLPSHDPGGYLIQRHNDLVESDDIAPRTTYDLGVVFGRSLLITSLPITELPPAMPQSNNATTRAIDNYLASSRRRSVIRLTRNDSHNNADLQAAISLFAKQCELKLPDYMLDGTDELIRGCHDYISVCTLLEAQENKRPAALRQSLGRVGLATRFGRFFSPHRPA